MRTQLSALATAPAATSAAPAALTVTGLRKSYGPVAAVRGVSFTVRRGMIPKQDYVEAVQWAKQNNLFLLSEWRRLNERD